MLRSMVRLQVFLHHLLAVTTVLAGRLLAFPGAVVSPGRAALAAVHQFSGSPQEAVGALGVLYWFWCWEMSG